MRAQAYHDLLNKQRKEIEEFPIAYAFSNEQLKEALEKLGVTDISECCTVCNHGDIVKKSDAKRFIEMLRRHNQEILDLLENKKLAEEIFEYEMDNHEYCINWDGDFDVLNSLGLDEKMLEEMNLKDAYRQARYAHMKRAHEEWDII